MIREPKRIPLAAVPTSSLIERRQAVLRGLRLYYDFPFRPVRGSGCWLWDAEGRRYLDAYNNVAQVGHCHPRVVTALAKQAATLNVHSRYHLDGLVDYAERLADLTPPGLDAVMFTCSGSEANDLAWRLARRFTGNLGVITTRHAYHGNTTFLDGIDGSAGRVDGAPDRGWATVPAPPDRGDAPIDSGSAGQAAYAAFMDVAIRDLGSRGYRPAAFFLDPLFCSDGVRIPDRGFVDAAIDRVRDAGALVVADEVQAGLARIGSHYWSSERLGIAPDIVVLGKSTGNGHPIGAVVTRSDIVDAFYASERYFNTFAGNPVSCAVGCAVLDVIADEELQAKAAGFGQQLMDELGDLAARHPVMGSIRGQGLLIGVDVRDPASGAPAGDLARHIIERLIRSGVVVGLTGPNRKNRNVLKIRPPLVFDEEAVAVLVSALDRVLTQMEQDLRNAQASAGD